MTDEEYLFQATTRERKDVARSARHKKRQGGRYVRLPSDNLTKKEREAMNGEVVTYKDKPFYSRDEFRALPDDLQIRWLNSIINRYNVGVTGISRIIFGNEQFLRCHIKSKGYGEYINKATAGKAATKWNNILQNEFMAFKNGADAQQEPDGAEPNRSGGEEAPADEQQAGNPITIRDECVKLARMETEAIDYARIAELIHALSGTGAKLTIEVTL